MKDLNQIKNDVFREMVKLDDQIKNARQINYEENELKRSTLQKMVHKFKFEIEENKAEVDDYIKENLPERRKAIQNKIWNFLAQLKEECGVLIRATKIRKKKLKALTKPTRRALRAYKKTLRKAYAKYRKYFWNRGWRKRLQQGDAENQADQRMSIILGIVALSIIELLLLILREYVDNPVLTIIAIVLGAIIGIMFLAIIFFALTPRIQEMLSRREVKLLERIRTKIEAEGETPDDIKTQGQIIKNEIINVKLDLDLD